MMTDSLAAASVGNMGFVAMTGSGAAGRQLTTAAPKSTPKSTAARVSRTNYTPAWKLYKVLSKSTSISYRSCLLPCLASLPAATVESHVSICQSIQCYWWQSVDR